MYVFTMLNKFGNEILAFLILENMLMIGLFINSVLHFFKIRKLDKSFERANIRLYDNLGFLIQEREKDK